VGEWRKAALAELERKLATDAMRGRQLVRVGDLAGIRRGRNTRRRRHRDDRAAAARRARDRLSLGARQGARRPAARRALRPSEERVLTQLAQHAQVALADSCAPSAAMPTR
jgi:hypothetical protein